MLASITPLGERGRRSTWALTVGSFATGATLAGAAMGALAAAAGAALLPAGLGPRERLGALALVLLVAGAFDALPAAVPGPRRQVNERWLDEYRGWVYGLGFGVQLGAGLATVVASAATYAALAAAFLSASAARGAVILGCFGAVRGLTPLIAASVRTPAALLALHAALARRRAASRRLAVATLAACALAAAAGMLA